MQTIMTHIVRLAPGRKPACPRTRKRRQVPRGDPGRTPLPPQTGRTNDRSAWPWLPATIVEQCRPDYPCCFRDSLKIRPRTTLGGAATPTSTTATRQPWPGSCCGSAPAPPSTPASPTGREDDVPLGVGNGRWSWIAATPMGGGTRRAARARADTRRARSDRERPDFANGPTASAMNVLWPPPGVTRFRHHGGRVGAGRPGTWRWPVTSSGLKSSSYAALAAWLARITMVTKSAPATEGGSRFGKEPRQRGQGATARPARRRRAIMLSGVVALALATGACTASGSPGGHAVRPARASTVAPPQHRGSGSHSVQLVVEASGDLLIHSAIFERALVLGGGRYYDFAPMFTQIKPYIRGADLALCHVETPMTPAPPAGYPTFNTPPALATAIAQTGWRACSTAATHSLDQGQTGVDDTIRALDRAGVAHTGTFSSAAAQKTPLIITVKGVRVAFLAYTELTNGIPSPHPWSVNRASAAQILSDAHRARADGAQVVIVNIHWGDQYVAQPSGFQLALASTLTRSPDITAVVGQHVHIVQPIRILQRQACRLRRRQPDLQPDQRLLPGRLPGRDDRAAHDHRGQPRSARHLRPLRADLGAASGLRGTPSRYRMAHRSRRRRGPARILRAHGRDSRARSPHPADPRPPVI